VSYFKSIKSQVGVGDIFVANPKMYRPLMTFVQEIMREESSLDPATREVIAAFTSYLNKCEYCYGSHKEFVRSLGFNMDLFDKIINNDYDDTNYKSLLDYVKKLTLSPQTMNKEDFDLVIYAGFSEENLEDVIRVCSFFNMINRIVHAYGVELHEEMWEEAATRINAVGYDSRRG
jgi:uncharacterized peroxidase-related enzyme